MKSYNQANSVFSYVRNLRKYFHMNPELSNQEEYTYQKIISELKKMKVEYETIGDYSVIAYINPHKKQKKNLAFRTQIDAIPITNIGLYPYKSKYRNISHSSGNDISMSILLGVIKKIKENENMYDGCLTIIFESSGFTYIGTKKILNSTVLDSVDYLFALYCSTEIPENTASIFYNQQFLGADVIEIKWYGESQPSSNLYNSKDTIMAAANFTDNIRSNLASNIPPSKIGIATVTKFLGGHIHHITANYCELNVNIRYQDNEIKNKIHKVINDTLKSTEKRFRVTTEDKVIHSIPPFIPDKDAVKIGEQSFLNIKNGLSVDTKGVPIYSEAFSIYGSKVKCSYGGFGANNLITESPTLSNEKFSPDEDSFKIGIAWYLEIAAQYLGNK